MSTTYCNDHDWGDNASYDLKILFKPHDEYDIDNNTIESGFGRVSTLGKKNPTYLEKYQSYEFLDKSGFGEVMTLVDVNSTILEDYKTFMHVDHEDKIVYDSYIIEFVYDPTCNYYERGKYGCRNFHVTKLPLFVLKLLMLHSSYLHMLDISCLDNLFAYEMPMHRKYVRLKCVFHMLHDASSCFNYYLSCQYH
jgi:hypothetical protein